MMGAGCSSQRQRAFWRRHAEEYHIGDAGLTRNSSGKLIRSAVRHAVVSEVPDGAIASLYPTEDNYVMDINNTRSPKSLVELCTDNICRNLPYLDHELPPGLPQDVVDDIVKSLMKHAALNATTLRILKNCEMGTLSLAGCRGVTDEWLLPLSRASTASPSLTHTSHNSDQLECMSSMDLDYPMSPSHAAFKNATGGEDSSCSTGSFVSASSTPFESTTHDDHPMDVKFSPLPVKDVMMHSLPASPSITSYLTLLDLRGSQRLTDQGLMQLHDLQSLEVAKLDGCHSLVGRGMLAFANSHRLHTLSLANCRRLSDEAIINISHLTSIEALSLDGCRCLTDRSLAAISNLYELQKLDLSQCDLLTDEGLDHLHDLKYLVELSLGWCRLVTDTGLNVLTQQPGRSSNLRILRLARCPITDEGVVHLSRLSALEELDLNGCSSIGSSALGNTLGSLKNLTTLDVSYCPGILRSSWQGKIPSLKTLELCYSSVRDVHLSRFADLPALEELNLDSSPIGDWAIAYLADHNVVPNLTSLDLADTEITDLGMAHLTKFEKLTRLSLFYCNISNNGLRHLKNMTSLEVLNLDSRDVGDDGLAHLIHLKNLKSLDIFSGRVTDVGCAHLSKIKSLESLELCGGGVGDLGCTLLASLENLTSLNLSQNERITNRGAAALAALSNLKALNLSNTRVNSTALRFFSSLVKLQSLALYGCRGIENGNGLAKLQSGLPSLKCLRLDSSSEDDGMIHLDPDQESEDEDMEFHAMRQRSDDSISVEDVDDEFHLHQDLDDDVSIYSDH
jgi:Leucine-rich repeat (LRR) protein